MFFQPLDDAFSISSSVVFDRFSGFVLAPEFESGEALDVDSGNFVFSRVDLDEQNVGVVGQSLGSLIIVGSESFAVSAPGSIELDEYFLGRVDNGFFPVFADNNLNGLIIGLGDRS